MDPSKIALFKEKIDDVLGDQADACEPEYWDLEMLVSLNGGSALGSQDACELILAFADELRFVPVITCLIDAAARDSEEFAGTLEVLEEKTGNDLAATPIKHAIRSIGVSRPELALSIAERLLKRSRSGHPDLLISGAAAGLPGECEDMIRMLLDSADARLQEIAIDSLTAAHASLGNLANWDVLEVLERASESDYVRVGKSALVAFVELRARDPRRCMRNVERLASKHSECARRLARLISAEMPFDVETSLRLLDICSEFSDPNVRWQVDRALEKLPSADPTAVLKIVIKYAERDGHDTNSSEHVLEWLGREHGARAVEALLGTPVNTAYMALYVSAMLRSLIASAGSEDSLEPVFEAIRTGSDIGMIAMGALHEIISDLHAEGASRNSILSATEDFLKSLAESKKVDIRRAIGGRKDQAKRCALLIRALCHQLPQYDLARSNMNRFPTLLSLFGRQWIDKEERSGGIHPLLYGLGQRLPSEEEASALTKAEPAETVEQLILSLDRRRHALGAWLSLDWLDQSLREIKEAGHDAARFAKRLKNAENFYPTISEMDFILPFLNGLEIEPKAGSKRLDLKLEVFGRSVYVEITSPEMLEELQLFSEARGIRDRVPRKILDKLEQLRFLDGRGCQVILAIDVGRSEARCEFVEDFLRNYGAETARAGDKRRDRLQTIESDKAEHARDPDRAVGVISAVVCYKMESGYDLKKQMKYKIIHNPHARVKLDEATTKFLKKRLGDNQERSAML